MAVRENSETVELGGSMNQWLERMGISVGGSTYRNIRDQADRLNLCRLTFYWSDGAREGFSKESIVTNGIRLSASDDRQGDLWREEVTLSRTFFEALKRHPVPIWEPAIRLLAGTSMGIDIYTWLAYRLHALSGNTPVSRAALFSQFGGGYAKIFHFWAEFRRALDMALAVYEDARVSLTDDGVILHPSRPPIPERAIGKFTG